jgi:hypothetical protein
VIDTVAELQVLMLIILIVPCRLLDLASRSKWQGGLDGCCQDTFRRFRVIVSNRRGQLMRDGRSRVARRKTVLRQVFMVAVLF